MDEDDDPLLLEDVIAQKPSALGKDDGLEVWSTQEHECHARGDWVHPEEGNDAVDIAAKLRRGTVELLANPTSRKNSVGQTLSRSLPKRWCPSSRRA